MNNIYVGNLDFEATEGTIRSLFEPHGSVTRVKLMTEVETGRSRGFAFVEMSDSGQADQAITALNGTTSGGHSISVRKARQKVHTGKARSEESVRRP